MAEELITAPESDELYKKLAELSQEIQSLANESRSISEMLNAEKTNDARIFLLKELKVKEKILTLAQKVVELKLLELKLHEALDQE